MIKIHRQTVCTFLHSVGAALIIALALWFSGHRTIGAGFGIGSLLSLFSLFTLGVCVPALFHKGSSQRSTALLHIALIMKLPIYGVGLYLATRMGSAASFAAFAGCTLVPCMITMETVSKMVVQANRNWRSAARLRNSSPLLPAIVELSHPAAEIKGDALESSSRSSQARAVREGAA